MSNGNTSANPATPADALADVVPFSELPRSYPALFRNKHTLAWLMRQRHANGLAAIIHVVGRTAYVSKNDFATWFRSRPAQTSRSDAHRRVSDVTLAAARAAKTPSRRGRA